MTEATWRKSGGKVVFSLGQLGIIMDENVLGSLPQRIHGKSILDGLNIKIKKAKTIKHLENNMEYLSDFRVGKKTKRFEP